MNLLDNAIGCSSPEEPVYVGRRGRGRPHRGSTVHDTASRGIPDRDLERIFGQGHRVDAARSGVPPG